MARRLFYLVTEDWYFLSHRLPMARAARDAGWEVHVATRVGKGAEAIMREGFVAHQLSWSRGSLSPWGSWSALREIRALLRRVQPEILHNISLKPVLLGSYAAVGLSSVRIVNSLTGIGTLFIGAARVNAVARHVVRIALSHALRRSTTIVQNPDDRDFVRALGLSPEKIVVIAGSGVDTDRLQPLPEPPLPVTAAYVGRMLADKGVVTLIEAFSLLKDTTPPIKLILAGDCDAENPGSLAPEQLREFASAFGIEWLGHVDDIRDVWKRAHFAVLASRREGLPKSLLEAAACGRAMVATDAPGCREIAIAGETALTVPVDDARALADAMNRLAQDSDMRARFGRRARELVQERFSSDAIGAETIALYARLTQA